MTAYESIVLGTDMASPLQLNDQTPFTLEQLSLTPAKKKPRFADGRDGPVLVDEEMAYDNADMPIAVRVEPQATMDLANAKVGLFLDMLQEAERRGSTGLPCSYTPTNGSTTWTWYLLLGEITNLPVDWESGWLALAPLLQVSLTRRPFFERPEVTGASVTASLPQLTLVVDDVPGDVPARARLVITDLATQARRGGDWGLENRYLAESIAANGGTAPPLLIDSDSLVVSGFVGNAGGTITGAYDPNGTGGNVVFAAALGQVVALCGTGDLKHIGTFRVKARVMVPIPSIRWRLSWQDGDGPFRSNAWAVPPAGNALGLTFSEVDLGVITIEPAAAGTQRWTGRIEMYDSDPSTAGTYNGHLDFIRLVPTGEGYGKARGAFTYTPGVISGYDDFASLTAGTNLNARTAPAGGSWATSGVATDFQGKASTGGSVTRSTVSEASPRFAILGSTSFTDVEVAITMPQPYSGTSGRVARLIVRWVDANNYLAIVAQPYSLQPGLKLVKVIAGVETILASLSASFATSHFSQTQARMTVYASGMVNVHVDTANAIWDVSISDSALATGGTLASGKVGFGDHNTSSVVLTREYDNFTVGTPAPEPVMIYSGQTLEFRSDRTIRPDSGGTKYGAAPGARGSFFKLPPAGNADRSSRIAVSVRRQDVETGEDVGITDSTKVQVFYNSRHLLPR